MGRSMSVLYGNADLDFVRELNLTQRGSLRSAENSRRSAGRTGEIKCENAMRC